MNNEQKVVLIAFLILFFLIPIYGLSHSLSTYNTSTRLSGGLVVFLEILLIGLSYIFFNVFSSKPFRHLKKAAAPLGIIAIILVIIILFIATSSNNSQSSNQLYAPTPTINPNYIAPSSFSILNGNGNGDYERKDYLGDDIYKLVVQNNSSYVANDIYVKFEFFKTQNGSAQDTKYIKLPQSIASGDTVTEEVSFYTSFDTTDQFWWRVTVMGATKGY